MKSVFHHAVLVGWLALSVSAQSMTARPPSEKISLEFGAHRLQRVDFWRGDGPSAPLVVFVHGGGWKRGDKRMMDDSAKLQHWRSLGYAVASVNYRLVPEATVEQQGADVAAAVALLHRKAGDLGVDAERIALVGHSAGAHLVALVGTDPQYLEGVGLSLDAIRGVVALDGAAYDVPTQLAQAGRLMERTYVQAFGTEADRQRALSPTAHADAPNVSSFLILQVERPGAAQQAQALASALARSGTRVSTQSVAGRGLKGHRDINRSLGDPDYPATPLVDAFLAEIFSARSRTS